MIIIMIRAMIVIRTIINMIMIAVIIIN